MFTELKKSLNVSKGEKLLKALKANNILIYQSTFFYLVVLNTELKKYEKHFKKQLFTLFINLGSELNFYSDIENNICI